MAFQTAALLTAPPLTLTSTKSESVSQRRATTSWSRSEPLNLVAPAGVGGGASAAAAEDPAPAAGVESVVETDGTATESALDDRLAAESSRCYWRMFRQEKLASAFASLRMPDQESIDY